MSIKFYSLLICSLFPLPDNRWEILGLDMLINSLRTPSEILYIDRVYIYMVLSEASQH